MKKLALLLPMIFGVFSSFFSSPCSPIINVKEQEHNALTPDEINYTQEEKDYIVAKGTIKVGLASQKYPFSLYDENSKTFSGINYDVMNYVSDLSGLNFTFVPQPVGQKIPALLDTDDYDISCGIERDNFDTNPKYIATDAYLNSSVVPIGLANKEYDLTDNLNIAVPSAFATLQTCLATNYPNLTVKTYASNTECLDAVLNGEADIIAQNTYIMRILLQIPKYSVFDTLPVEIMKEHSAILLSRTDTVLLSILNKSVDYIADKLIDTILIKHTYAYSYTYTLDDYFYVFKKEIITGSIMLLVILGLLIGLIVFLKHSKNTLATKNGQLKEAVNQANKANKAKSQFLSRMSHEIRTPMNAIVGLTEIAKHHEENPEEIDDYLSKISVSSKVLLNIINDVLDMSAIESSKLKISDTDFDIKQVCNNISVLYYPQCNNKGVTFQMVTNLEHEYLIGDPLRLNQILLNFVSNAFKFTPRGGKITISVSETLFKEGVAYLRFTIADTGCGMSEEMQKRLFKPFEQESASTAQKYGGSGLGLSIAKNLVDMMHGAISVKSKENEGTTFIVDIPFKVTSNKTNATSNLIESISILTVDDDKQARDYSQIVLKRMNAHFDVASSGQEALEMIKKAIQENHPYQVCLVDWKMQGMDGIELTKEIRKIEKSRTLIIIVSAFDLNEVQDQAKDAGADHFISKPLFQSTLFNVLMSLSNKTAIPENNEQKNYDFSTKRALLAEDNSINSSIAIELLKMVNLKVDLAENGQAAVDMFNSHKENYYDIILMDIQMPILNGYEATKAIRKLDRKDAKKIPIIAMTADAFSSDVSLALASGMNGHIAKPIDTKTLYETIDKAVK